MQTTNEKELIDIDDIVFEHASDNEIDIINRHKSKKYYKDFFRRMKLSAVIAVIIFLIQYAGTIFGKYDYDIGEKFLSKEQLVSPIWSIGIVVILIFAIFNLASILYTLLRVQIISLSEEDFVLRAEIVKKYSGKNLTKDGKERKKNYVTFTCEQGECSRAIVVSPEQYKDAFVGEKIVVIKAVSVDKNELIYISERDFK